MRNLFFLLLTLGLYLSSSLLAQTSHISLTSQERMWLAEHKKIVVGGETDWAPFDFVDVSGNYAGISNDYLKVIGEKLGIEVEIVTRPSWSELQKMARQKKIDVLPAINHSEERTTYLNFTRPYAKTTRFIFTHDETHDISSMEDLSDKTVAVVKGYNMEGLLRSLYPDIKLITFPTMLVALKKIITHEADAFIGSITSISYTMQKHSLVGIKAVAPTPFEESHLRMGIRHDWPELRDLIQKVFDAMPLHEHNAIKARWISDVVPPSVDLTSAEKRWLAEHPVLKLGYDIDWPPIEQVNEDGKLIGMSADYFSLLEQRLGITIEPAAPTDWVSMLELARKGEVDLMSAVVQTQQRDVFLEFTAPYLSFPMVIVTRDNVTFISDMNQLEGKNVGVVSRYASHNYLTNNHPKIKIKLARDVREGLLDVVKGDTYAFIGSLATISRIIAREGLGELKVSGETPYKYELRIGIKKNEPLLVSIMQKALDSISEEEKAEISSRWFSVTYEHKTDYTIIYQLIVLAAFILFGIVLWNVSLKLKVAQRTQQLGDSNRTWQAIMSASLEAIYVMDTKGVIFSCNEAGAKRFNQSVSELLGKNILTLLPIKVAEYRKGLLSQVLQTKQSIRFEDSRDGKYLNNAFYPVFNANGDVEKLVVLSSDITERKCAEKAMQESELRLANFFEASFEGIFLHEDGKVLDVNPATIKIFGYDATETIGRNLLEFVSPESREKVINQMADGDESSYEVSIIAKDGSIIPVEARAKTMTIEGKLIRVASLHDITKRKHAESALQESESYYRSMFETSLYGIAITGSDFKFQRINTAFCNLLEYEENELIGKLGIGDVTHQDDLEASMTQVKKLISGEINSFKLEKRYITKSGRVVDSISFVQAVYDENGRYISSTASIMDITDHKEAERELRQYKEELEYLITKRTKALSEAKELLTNIFASTNVLLAYMDRDFNFIKVNKAYADTEGYSPEYFIGKNHFDLYPDKENKTIFRQVVESGIPYSVEAKPFEYSNGAKHGVSYWDWTLQPIKDENGNVEGLVLTLIDVTEHKRLQADIIQAKDSAEEANRTKSTFLSNMSHEIRTPMNAILGFSELMLNTELDDKQKNYVAKTLNAADTLLILINDILDLSKIEAGKLKISNNVFNPADILKQSIDLLLLDAKQKDISLEYEIDENIPEYLIGDSTRIRQVIINLLSNAVKFTDKGSVHVSLFVEHQDTQSCRVEFTVTDTGIGISQENQVELFEHFTQVDNSSTRAEGGTGLGLAICKQLVEAMGGSIEVESEYGEGSTFSFTLTLDIPETDVSLSATVQEHVMHFSDLKILLAEDNDDNREIASKMLKSLGGDVDEAINGKIAVEMVRKNHYDLVLMDIQMPEMDGLSATRMLRNEGFSDLLIIAVSAHASKTEQKRSIDAGMNAHLNKPFKPKELQNLLLHWYPTKVVENTQISDEHSGCWAHELPVIPGLVFSDEICNYWLKKDDFLKRLEPFILNTTKQSELLRKMMDEKNIPEVLGLLHKLRGSVKLYGANRLFESVVQFEDALKRDDNSAISDIHNEFDAAVLEISTQEFLSTKKEL